MLWKPLLQVSCLFLCTTGQTQGRLYTARRKPASGSHQRNRFGPHMCHSAVGAGSGCCPGWAPSPSTGQCVLPICPFGCGSGFCIAPNVCSCRSGRQSITCPDEGVATDFLAQYVEGALGKGSSHSCVSAMCEHSCLIISGVPVCSCFHGYSLGKDGRSCYDVDECSRSRGPALCQHQCRNSLGSYRCHCYHGYQISSNGRSCIPVKSMTPNEAPGVCGEYGCTLSCNHGGCEHISRVCPPGFSMSELANGVMCIDIDECETASCEGICLNTDGGFVCECKPGMQLSADRQSCVDIDECSENRAPCQHRCRNIYGSYKCVCNPGFTLHGNGHSCADLNECRRPGGTRLCQHACQNTFGSYFCVCRSGFKLHADKVSCEDVDECSLSADRLLLPCLHLCLNTAGSYLCSCHQGYQLAADGHTCQESPDLARAPAPILHSPSEAVSTTVVPSYPRGFMKPPPTLSSSPPSRYFHPSPGPGPPAREAAAPTFPPLHSSPLSVQPAPMPTKPTPTNGSVVGPLTSMPSLPAPFTKSPVKSLTRTPSPLAPTTKSPVSQQNITSLPLITSPSTLTTKTPGERLPSTTSPPMPLTTSAFVSLSTTQSPTASTTDRLFISLTPTNSSSPSPSPTSSPPRTPFTAPSSLRVPTTRSHLTPLTTPADSPLAQKASKISHISLKEDSSPPALLQPLPESPASSLISMAESHTITPPPTMCWHEGTWHIDGSHWEGPGCLQCVCQAGHFLCQEVVCSVPCSHPVPVPGPCCPSCDGCLYEGVFRAEGDVFPLTEDDCVVCICIAGNVTCISPDCPVVTCLDPILSDCCLRCPAECVFRDQTYPHGAEFSRDGDKCSSCVCRNGEVECSFAPCPMLDCPREDWLLEPGECCFTCQEFQTVSGCPVDDNGVEFPIGQIWSPGDPCEICVCQADSTVTCKKTECIETCPHPILVPGQCCPDCSAGCSYGRTIFQNNESFPSPSDPCLTCICLFGSVACSPLECTISCTYPFHAEGDCCPVCRDCTYEGRKVLDGQAFLTEKDPCTQCTCQRGEVSCEEITCQLSCTDPYTPPGECCPTCSECLYEGQVLEDGGYYVSKYDPCILCNCEAGNVDCEWRGDDCPQLDCEQEPIHPAGTCCPLCPDEDLTSLSDPIQLQFDEMEPIKIFRNPRGASHRQLHSIDMLQSSTPPVQQINPHRIILPKATDNLKIVHSVSAKEQTTLHHPEAPNSKLEFHIDSKHRSLFPVTAEMGTRTIVMSFSNPTALPISLPTTSILPPGLSDSSLPPVIAPVFSEADSIPPLTMKIVPTPPQTSTSAISLMSLPHFRILSLNHISSRVAFSSQISSTTTISSLPLTSIPASCLNHLNVSTANTSGPHVSSAEPATSLPLESHSGLFKYPKQLLSHSPSITASSSLTPSSVGVLQPSLSPTVKSLNAVPNYVLPMTSPTEYVQSFTNVHSHSLLHIGFSDISLSDAEISRPSVFPTPVYVTSIPSTDIALPLFLLTEDPVTSNSWESDSSLPLTGTFEVPLQPSKNPRGMNEPDKTREQLMTAAEWNHKRLMLQTDTNMQRQRGQSG